MQVIQVAVDLSLFFSVSVICTFSFGCFHGTGECFGNCTPMTLCTQNYTIFTIIIGAIFAMNIFGETGYPGNSELSAYS